MDVMEVMYKMMGALHKINAPVVFKGSLVLRQLINTETDLNTYRSTQDFDIDWLVKLLSKEKFEQLFQEVLASIGFGHLRVVCVLEPKKNSNGTFNIYAENNNPIFSIDLAKKRNEWWIEYNLPGGIAFKGSSPNKMFVDKLAVISGKAVLNRVQDINDMYLISHLKGFRLNALKDTVVETKRTIYAFEEFLTDDEVEFLREKYDNLDDIVNPPPFELIYGRVRDFCMPFILNITTFDMEWIVSEQKWLV